MDMALNGSHPLSDIESRASLLKLLEITLESAPLGCSTVQHGARMTTEKMFTSKISINNGQIYNEWGVPHTFSSPKGASKKELKRPALNQPLANACDGSCMSKCMEERNQNMGSHKGGCCFSKYATMIQTACI